jgi:hypothetical protein
MRRIGVRHLDNRRSLLPYDYLADPWAFGQPGRVGVVMPEGGDVVSQRIALQVHRLAVAVRSRHIRSTEACARFEFSREVWSEVLAGRRWPGETVLAAIIDALAGG